MNGQELALLAAIGAVAGLFLPMLSGAGQKYRYRKMLRCPDTGKTAEIYIVASPERLSFHTRIRAKACSLWPEKKGCAQKCLERG